MTKTLKFLSEVNLVRSCIFGSGAKGGFPACVSGVGIHAAIQFCKAIRP